MVFSIKTYNGQSTEPYLSESTGFSILQIHPYIRNPAKFPLHLMVTLDVSTRMGPFDATGKNMLDYIKETLYSMILYLRRFEDRKILFSLITFSSEAQLLFKYLPINELNEQRLFSILNSISISNGVNFEKAFNLVHSTWNDVHIFDSLHLNLFFTQGFITEGLKDPPSLSYLIRGPQTFFIAYGNSYEKLLLRQLAHFIQGEFEFAPTHEAGNSICSKILSRFLNPAFQWLRVEIKNGQIYSSKTGQFESKLIVPYLPNQESQRFFCQLSPTSEITIEYQELYDYRGVRSRKKKSLLKIDSFSFSNSKEIHLFRMKERVNQFMRQIILKLRSESLLKPEEVMKRIDRPPIFYSNPHLREECNRLCQFIILFEKSHLASLNPEELSILERMKEDLTVGYQYLQSS